MAAFALVVSVYRRLALLFIFVIFLLQWSEDSDNQVSDAKLDRNLRMHQMQQPHEVVQRMSSSGVADGSSVLRTKRVERETELQYHPERVKFLHSAVGLQGDDPISKHGLFAKNQIPFGTILAIEYPLFKLSERDEEKYKSLEMLSKMYMIYHKIGKQMMEDPEFEEIWDSLKAPIPHSSVESFLDEHHLAEEQIIPLVYDYFNFRACQYGDSNERQPMAVYSILGRINFGLPQNVLVVSGGKEHDFVSILIATTNIEEGERIEADVFKDWDKLEGSNSWALTLKRGIKIVYNEDGDSWPNNRRDLTWKESLQVYPKIYSSGFIDKAADGSLHYVGGCEHLNEEQCELKKSIVEVIQSGMIFEIAAGAAQPPQWMGQELIDQQYRFNL